MVASPTKCQVIDLSNGTISRTISNPRMNKTDSCEFRACRFGVDYSTGLLYTVVNTVSKKKAIICKWSVLGWSMEFSKAVARKPITSFAQR